MACWFTMAAFDRLVTFGAKTGKREVSGCRLVVNAPGSLPSPISSQYPHAYCHSNSHQTFKRTHNVDKTIILLLQAWACRFLPRHWYDNNTSSHWIWRNFGTCWRIFCGHSGLFSLLFVIYIYICIAGNFRQEFNFVAFVKAIF